MTFDPTKPVRTKAGRPARIICTDAECSEGQTIVALTRDSAGEYAIMRHADGRMYRAMDTPHDLINVNVPERHVRWVNVYSLQSMTNDRSVHHTEDEAHRAACVGRIACIRIEFEDGEGLD